MLELTAGDGLPKMHRYGELLRAMLVTLVDVGLFVVLARFLRLGEVTEVVDMVSRRLPSVRGR